MRKGPAVCTVLRTIALAGLVGETRCMVVSETLAVKVALLRVESKGDGEDFS